MKEKYAKITINILICIPVIVSLLFIDKYVLPQKKIDDKIIAYSTISTKSYGRYTNKYNSTSKINLGTKFFTQKGFKFSIVKGFIEENQVTIERSYIFRNITSVKSQTEDFSNKLTSGLNGSCLYFTIGSTIISIISILMLKLNKTLSENGFQNIILVNAFLIICTLYLYVTYN